MFCNNMHYKKGEFFNKFSFPFYTYSTYSGYFIFMVLLCDKRQSKNIYKFFFFAKKTSNCHLLYTKFMLKIIIIIIYDLIKIIILHTYIQILCLFKGNVDWWFIFTFIFWLFMLFLLSMAFIFLVKVGFIILDRVYIYILHTI